MIELSKNNETISTKSLFSSLFSLLINCYYIIILKKLLLNILQNLYFI